MNPNVLVVGAGAVGALYGSALARQGARVGVVCRSDYDIIRREGYTIRSALLGDHRFRPEQVYRAVQECQQPPEYLLVTTKVLAGEDRAALLRPAVAAHTTIVLIQNGVHIEEEIAAAFPANELLSALAFVGVYRSQPGEVIHQTLGMLTLGRYPSGVTPAAQRLATLFESSSVQCRLVEDVVSARWQKAVWNAAFNPVSIMGGGLDSATMLKTESATAFMRQLMQEVCSVAQAAGYPQPPQLIEQLIAGTKAMPPYKTSMALDYENDRPMEIEAILGNVVRTGRRTGVAMPGLEAVYALAKMIEGKGVRSGTHGG